jgi:hypothetical protein
MLFKENSAIAGVRPKDTDQRFTSPRDRLHERWQVSWLAGQRRTPIFPVSQ